MMTTIIKSKTKSKSKSKSKKLHNDIQVIDNNTDDNDNDNDNDTEIEKKLLSKKVIKIQNETISHLQTKFIQNNGLISLSYF